MIRTCEIETLQSDGIQLPIKIELGSKIIYDLISIICPNEIEGKIKHLLVNNGHDTSVIGNPQQIVCQTCGKSFYPHTSKFFKEMKDDIREIIAESLKRGRLNAKALSRRLQLNKSTISKLLLQIIQIISKSVTKSKIFKNKKRRSNCLFIDETFLKIGKKTWYLIVVVSGNNKIMAVELVLKRSKENILKIVRDCADRLLYGLQILVSDGFLVYIGVARALNKDLIHIRHIHKPPYGRIIIEIYKYGEFDFHKTSFATTNEITAVNGYFLGQIKITKESLGKKIRGRKPGSKNRPKEVILAEKKQKQKNRIPRGRPPGKTNKQDWELHIFNHDKKGGQITALNGSSSSVTAVMNKILKQFRNMHITSNLVEKEFSALKKLIDFRGRRSMEIWDDLLYSYYIIRDEPKILKHILSKCEISYNMVKKSLPKIISCQVCAM